MNGLDNPHRWFLYNRLLVSCTHCLHSCVTQIQNTQIHKYTNTQIQLINERFQAHIVSILVSAATPLGISLLRATLLCFFRAASFTCHNPCHATVPLWLCHLSFVGIEVTGCKKGGDSKSGTFFGQSQPA